MRAIRLVPATIVAVIACGCTIKDVEFGLIGVELPALTAELPGEPLDSTRSVDGFDRRSWPTVTVRVPAEQVRVTASYGELSDREQPRPQYPTAVGALLPQWDDERDLSATIFGIVYPVVQIVWWPIEMVMGRWPWMTERRPIASTERVALTGSIDGLWSWVAWEPIDQPVIPPVGSDPTNPEEPNE